MKNNNILFQSEEISKSIQDLISTLQKKISNSDRDIYKFLLSAAIELSQVNTPDSQTFPYCAESFGKNLPMQLNDIREGLSEQYANNIFVTLFSFLAEKEIQTRDIQGVIGEINRKISTSNVFDELKERIKIIDANIASDVMRNILNKNEFTTLKEIMQSHSKAIEEKKKWNEEYSIQSKAISDSKAILKNMRTEFGFVALKYGFQNLHDRKLSQAASALLVLVFFGITMLAIPIIEISYLSEKNINIEKSPIFLAAIAIPMITVQFIFFYFFKISLQNYRSIRAQQLQIDLRISICQFFESYVDFVGKNKDISESLAKFENLIFSGIVANEGDIPSLFDGTDQLIKIIQSSKSK
ncbi:hypothetical protein LJR066_002516 [Acidovorax sp. LjRoot66]|uniref:hypothetical protein n=1 Tax=Acidovorax sp. LjRoot66 TaxID=3342334 RepID=UPI003ECD06F0